MSRADIMVLIACLVIGLVAIPLAIPAGSDGAFIRSPHGTTAIDLAVDSTYEVEGLFGTLVFRVEAGRLSCIEADCPDRICVRSGPSKTGRPIICAPNGVVAFADDQRGGDVDAVSR